MTIEPPAAGVAAAADLLARLRLLGLTVATAESLTGGLVAASITALPGASAAFRGGAVAYATAVKASVLGVPQELLETVGPVHQETAAAMASAARVLFGADLGIATTGVAGPDPVGTIGPGVMFVAAVLGDGVPRVERLHGHGDRRELRSTCTAAALAMGLAVLPNGNPLRE